MKIRLNKKAATNACIIISSAATAVLFFIFLKNNLPHAISYSISVSQNESTISVSESNENKALYENISDITYSGPFLIKESGNMIFVCYGDKKLYRINKLLSELTPSDIESIHRGIPAKDKNALYEIVSYIES